MMCCGRKQETPFCAWWGALIDKSPLGQLLAYCHKMVALHEDKVGHRGGDGRSRLWSRASGGERGG